MRIGVAADLMPLGNHPFEQRPLRQRILADHEERRRRMLALEDVEDLRRPFGIGTIVEGQRELFRAIAGPHHDIGRRHPREIDVGDRTVLGRHRITDTGDGLGGDLQDLSIALDIDVGARRHGVDRIGDRQFPMIAPPDRPEPRVLGAEPPQRDAPQSCLLQEGDLVVRRRRIEQPDLMLNAALGIGEAAVAAGLVEGRHRAGVRGVLPRFLDVERVAVAALSAGMPVVSVGADRDDQLRRRDAACRIGDHAGEPALRGDRARRAARLVLVIGHEEDLVGHLGVGRQVPVGVRDRRGDRDHPAARREAGAGLGEERAVVGLRRRRQILEIVEDAARMVRGEERYELVEERRAGLRIGCAAGAVPIAVDRVLHHRQDHRAMHRLVQDIAPGLVAEHGDLVILAGDRDPAGDQPVELLDVPRETGRARLVPRHVEGDCERRVGAVADTGLGRARPEQLPGVVVDVAPGLAEDPAARCGQLVERGVLGLDRQQRRGRHRADRHREYRDRQQQQCDERCNAKGKAPTPAATSIIEDGIERHGTSINRRKENGKLRFQAATARDTRTLLTNASRWR
jgi:hypothetical protein